VEYVLFPVTVHEEYTITVTLIDNTENDHTSHRVRLFGWIRPANEAPKIIQDRYKETKPVFKADFSVTRSSVLHSLTVYCTDKSIGNPTMIVYNFGDGFKATGKNPVHTYRFPWTYEVKLTVLRINSDFTSLQSSAATGTIGVNAV
jgi:PKD repeat protein